MNQLHIKYEQKFFQLLTTIYRTKTRISPHGRYNQTEREREREIYTVTYTYTKMAKEIEKRNIVHGLDIRYNFVPNIQNMKLSNYIDILKGGA